MIVRQWSGRAAAEQRGAYPAHFRARVLPELRSLPGFLGAELLERDLGGRIEYQVLTRWDSLAAIARFAGEDPERAVVEPGAAAALLDHDDRVRHYTLAEEART